ncbi:MAG: hypothetical protein HOV68_29500 [Streptomycetaceae bacterium]|nr:hypothetical protein [Streptomycetaceae bacterium]
MSTQAEAPRTDPRTNPHSTAVPGARRWSGRSVRTRLLAAGVAGAALMTACGVEGKAKAEPLPSNVCDGILSSRDVTGLLPKGKATVREEQKPEDKYPLLRCEVTVNGVSFVGSAYLSNMAGTDLVQLAGSTAGVATPLLGVGENTNINGMAGPDDVWLVPMCTVNITDAQGKTTPTPIPYLVRARVVGAPDKDQRNKLSALAAKLAAGVYKSANCGDQVPRDPAPVPPAPVPAPITDAPICGVLDPRALGDVAQGEQRRRWTAVYSVGYVQSCDLYLDGVRAFSFTVAKGAVAPFTEIPGERPRLTQRLPMPPDSTPAPPKNAKVGTSTPPGTVVAAVNSSKTYGNNECYDAYRMSRHDGPALPAAALNVPIERAFRAFVDGSSKSTELKNCAIPADAEWLFG